MDSQSRHFLRSTIAEANQDGRAAFGPHRKGKADENEILGSEWWGGGEGAGVGLVDSFLVADHENGRIRS